MLQSRLDALKSIAQETKIDYGTFYGTLAQNAIKTNQEFTTNLVSQALTHHNQYALETFKSVFNEMKTIDKVTREKIEAAYKEQRESIERNVALIMSDGRKGKFTSMEDHDGVHINVGGLYKGKLKTEIEGGCLAFEIKSSKVSEVKCKLGNCFIFMLE